MIQQKLTVAKLKCLKYRYDFNSIFDKSVIFIIIPI